MYFQIQYRNARDESVHSDGCGDRREFFHALLDEFLNAPPQKPHTKTLKGPHLIFAPCTFHANTLGPDFKIRVELPSGDWLLLSVSRELWMEQYRSGREFHALRHLCKPALDRLAASLGLVRAPESWDPCYVYYCPDSWTFEQVMEAESLLYPLRGWAESVEVRRHFSVDEQERANADKSSS